MLLPILHHHAQKKPLKIYKAYIITDILPWGSLVEIYYEGAPKPDVKCCGPPHDLSRREVWVHAGLSPTQPQSPLGLFL